MKILHVALGSAFTEGMTYQENFLVDQNIKDGHSVTIVSDCNKFEQGKIVRTNTEDIILPNGIRLIRLEFDKVITPYISSKIRKVSKLKGIIEQISPDVILFHGVAGWELLTVSKYKKDNPHIKLYVDSHEDYNNSARNFVSKQIQYKLFNRIIVNKVLPYIDKILCVGFESFTFLEDLYKVPREMMEFYPLGGTVPVEIERQQKRKIFREKLNLIEDDILVVHSGKMDKLKRTEDILEAFTAVSSNRLKLVLIGTLSEDIKENVEKMVASDKRIKYLGWKTGDEILDYLCACDLYMQPGSKSATLQNALCCGSTAAIFPHKSYKYYLSTDVLYYVKTIDDIKKLLEDISKNPRKLDSKRVEASKMASEILDYKILASRIYS